MTTPKGHDPLASAERMGYMEVPHSAATPSADEPPRSPKAYGTDYTVDEAMAEAERWTDDRNITGTRGWRPVLVVLLGEIARLRAAVTRTEVGRADTPSSPKGNIASWDNLAAIVDPDAYDDRFSSEFNLEMVDRRVAAREKVRLIENAMVAGGWQVPHSAPPTPAAPTPEGTDGPEWTCTECGSTDGVQTVVYDTPGEPRDYDARCLACGSTEVEESLRDALLRVIDQRDEARSLAQRPTPEGQEADHVHWLRDRIGDTTGFWMSYDQARDLMYAVRLQAALPAPPTRSSKGDA